MTVGDLQQYLRALAVALEATKGPAKDVTEAADALTPFGAYPMSSFGAFLRAVEQKYAESKTLPDVPQPKEKKAAAARKTAGPKPETKTVAELKVVINQLRGELASEAPPDRSTVEARLQLFETLPALELTEIVKSMGYTKNPKNRGDSIKIIAKTLMAPGTASARAEV